MRIICTTPPESRPPELTEISAPAAHPPPVPLAPAPIVPSIEDAAAVRTATAVARALLEAAAGRRNLDQVAATLAVDPAALRDWAAAGPDPRGIRRVRTERPRDGVIEAAVVWVDGPSPALLALRLERHGGRWFCTALTRPPAPALPRRLAS